MADILKSIVQFNDVPAGASVSAPHGINVKGRPEIPDRLDVDNGAFTVTGNDTDVTVTNKSLGVASVGVLCNMWHSIPRVFGKSYQDVQDSLPIRPFVPAGAGSGAAADADDIVTGNPIRVRGSFNAPGVSLALSRADHDHRLELQVEDGGALAGARPTINFIGLGVGAIADNAGGDRVDITIPGTPSDGTVVKRSVALEDTASTSSPSFVDGMSAMPIVVPMDGEYWAIWEGECRQSNANSTLEVGISVNSVVAVTPGSERRVQSDAADLGNFISTIQLGALFAGDLVRGLFRRSSGAGPMSVTIEYRHLSIFKVQ